MTNEPPWFIKEPERNSMIRVGVTGCAGRMGSLLVREIQAGAEGLTLAGGTEKAGLPNAGFFVAADPVDLFTRSDVIIDFTTPAATMAHVRLAERQRKSLVIGTTGLGAAEEKEIRDAAQKCAIVY